MNEVIKLKNRSSLISNPCHVKLNLIMSELTFFDHLFLNTLANFRIS